MSLSKPIIIVLLFLVVVVGAVVHEYIHFSDYTSKYHILCQIDGLTLYDGMGTDLQYVDPESTDLQLIFLDENGDEVFISNKAFCQVEEG